MGCKLQGVAQIASFLYKRRPGHLPYILLSNDTKKSHLELKRYLLLKVFLAMKLVYMLLYVKIVCQCPYVALTLWGLRSKASLHIKNRPFI